MPPDITFEATGFFRTEKTDRQHSGLQHPFGRHYGPMAEVFSRFSTEMYDVATGYG